MNITLYTKAAHDKLDAWVGRGQSENAMTAMTYALALNIRVIFTC